jgi:hypothetical protein
MVDLGYSPAVQARGPVLGYRVMRLVPHDGDEPLYQIKTILEPFERIVRENELSLVARVPIAADCTVAPPKETNFPSAA